jgi:hypothetical protein
MKFRLCKAACKAHSAQHPVVVDGKPKWECKGCGAFADRRLAAISPTRMETLARINAHIAAQA